MPKNANVDDRKRKKYARVFWCEYFALYAVVMGLFRQNNASHEIPCGCDEGGCEMRTGTTKIQQEEDSRRRKKEIKMKKRTAITARTLMETNVN